MPLLDEVDSVLIDEARSPIGISDKAPEDSLDLYRQFNKIAPNIPDLPLKSMKKAATFPSPMQASARLRPCW